MKIVDRVATILICMGFPTAMALNVLSDRSYWSNARRVVTSMLFVVTGTMTLIPFALGFGWFMIEDWLDDRNATAYNKGE